MFLKTFPVADEEKRQQYAKPVEAEGAEFVGGVHITCLVAALLVVVIVDLPLLRKQCSRMKRNIVHRCKRRKSGQRKSENKRWAKRRHNNVFPDENKHCSRI